MFNLTLYQLEHFVIDGAIGWLLTVSMLHDGSRISLRLDTFIISVHSTVFIDVVRLGERLCIYGFMAPYVFQACPG